MELYKVVDGKIVEYAVLVETEGGCGVVRSGNQFRRPRWLVRGKDFDVPEWGEDIPEFFFTEDEALEAYREFQG